MIILLYSLYTPYTISSNREERIYKFFLKIITLGLDPLFIPLLRGTVAIALGINFHIYVNERAVMHIQPHIYSLYSFFLFQIEILNTARICIIFNSFPSKAPRNIFYSIAHPQIPYFIYTPSFN